MKNIEYKKTGKLIVAVKNEEIERLYNLYENGVKNNVPQLKLLETKEEIQEYEPLCNGIKAIYCGSTGIVNYKNVAKSYLDDFLSFSSQNAIYLGCKVIDFSGLSFNHTNDISKFENQKQKKSKRHNFSEGIRIHYQKKGVHSANDGKNSLTTKYVITCAGVHTDRISVYSGVSPLPKMIPLRGSYLEIIDHGFNQKLRGLNIYPVPDPSLPYLGIHFTPLLNEQRTTILGPTSVLAYGRESYSYMSNINLYDIYDILTFGGFWKLFSKHWKFGFEQLFCDIFWEKQIRELQKYIPSLEEYHVKKSSLAGIRGQAVDMDGNMIDDFVFDCDDERRFLHVRNAPSPAATASLAIAEMIVNQAKNDFQWENDEYNCKL